MITATGLRHEDFPGVKVADVSNPSTLPRTDGKILGGQYLDAYVSTLMCLGETRNAVLLNAWVTRGLWHQPWLMVYDREIRQNVYKVICVKVGLFGQVLLL